VKLPNKYINCTTRIEAGDVGLPNKSEFIKRQRLSFRAKNNDNRLIFVGQAIEYDVNVLVHWHKIPNRKQRIKQRLNMKQICRNRTIIKGNGTKFTSDLLILDMSDGEKVLMELIPKVQRCETRNQTRENRLGDSGLKPREDQLILLLPKLILGCNNVMIPIMNRSKFLRNLQWKNVIKKTMALNHGLNLRSPQKIVRINQFCSNSVRKRRQSWRRSSCNRRCGRRQKSAIVGRGSHEQKLRIEPCSVYHKQIRERERELRFGKTLLRVSVIEL